MMYDQVDHRPTDCDFFHAPMGHKDCHYEREVRGSQPHRHVLWRRVGG
jgi:hypothetical protein